MNRLNWKRIYEEPEKNDGFRVFVDRLWARGIKKEDIIVTQGGSEALTMAMQMKMKLWIATCLLAFIIIYAVQFISFSQEVFLPLLSSFMAGLLFLVPGIQFHNEYKKRNNVC